MEQYADYDQLLRLVRERRSIRSFRDDPVDPGLIDRILEAARWAPSGGNRQPWRFAVVTSPEVRRQMGEAVQNAVDAYKAKLAPERASGYSAYLDAFGQPSEAPVVIGVFYRPGGRLLTAGLRPELRDDPDAAAPAEVGALASASAAIQNLLLAAHALGLGACWMTGPLLAAPALCGLCGVPEGWKLCALVPVGHPTHQPEPPRRKALARLVRRISEKTTPEGS